jgi:hypothetical protein
MELLADRLSGFFDGLTVVPPGIVSASQWPDSDDDGEAGRTPPSAASASSSSTRAVRAADRIAPAMVPWSTWRVPEMHLCRSAP